MTRVDELQGKYPSIPRHVLVKVEAITRGIRDSDVLYNLGHWHRSGSSSAYQTHDHDTSLKEVADKRPTEAAKAGYLRRLGSFYMKGGWGVEIERDSTSPYEIREPEPGRHALFEGEEKVQDIYFPPTDLKPWPYQDRQEPLTSTGKPITTVVPLRSPTCARVNPMRYCEYFSTGEQCKFCNYNASQEDARSAGAIRAVATPLEEVVEAYKILTSEARIIETCFVSGSFTDVERESKINSDVFERITSAAPYKINISHGQQPPKSRRDIQRWKDSGVDSVSFQVEVWDPELFAKICPGKAKHVGYERYREAWLEAVDVLGAGQVAGTMVAGATLLPANGHKRWQESRDTLIEGSQWLIKNGVLPLFVLQRWAPGSEFSKDPSGRDRLPPAEHHLDVMLAVHAAMKEHGLYEKMNRFLGHCPMCLLDQLPNFDLGVHEATGGNASKWLAPLIPDEANWLARIAEWVEEAETVKTR